jgi:hypothetical protein
MVHARRNRGCDARRLRRISSVKRGLTLLIQVLSLKITPLKLVSRPAIDLNSKRPVCHSERSEQRERSRRISDSFARRGAGESASRGKIGAAERADASEAGTGFTCSRPCPRGPCILGESAPENLAWFRKTQPGSFASLRMTLLTRLTGFAKFGNLSKPRSVPLVALRLQEKCGDRSTPHFI